MNRVRPFFNNAARSKPIVKVYKSLAYSSASDHKRVSKRLRNLPYFDENIFDKSNYLKNDSASSSHSAKYHFYLVKFIAEFFGGIRVFDQPFVDLFYSINGVIISKSLTHCKMRFLIVFLSWIKTISITKLFPSFLSFRSPDTVGTISIKIDTQSNETFLELLYFFSPVTKLHGFMKLFELFLSFLKIKSIGKRLCGSLVKNTVYSKPSIGAELFPSLLSFRTPDSVSTKFVEGISGAKKLLLHLFNFFTGSAFF